MGHIHEKGPHAMHNKSMVEGIPYCSKEVELCENCIHSKDRHVSFSFMVTRTKEIVELIHNDLFGPIPIP